MMLLGPPVELSWQGGWTGRGENLGIFYVLYGRGCTMEQTPEAREIKKDMRREIAGLLTDIRSTDMYLDSFEATLGTLKELCEKLRKEKERD